MTENPVIHTQSIISDWFIVPGIRNINVIAGRNFIVLIIASWPELFQSWTKNNIRFNVSFFLYLYQGNFYLKKSIDVEVSVIISIRIIFTCNDYSKFIYNNDKNYNLKRNW